MKKTVSIAILFLLVILTGSKTLAYWPGGELSFPPLFHVQTSGIKIGFWDFAQLPDLILDNPDFNSEDIEKGVVIRLNDRYYYVAKNQGWEIDLQRPWDNPFKLYGIDHQLGIYYKEGSYVVKDGHIFRAHNEGASHHMPQINGNEYIWADLGSIEALTWRKDRIPKDDTPIYWKGKLYLKNEDFVENIEPGRGKGYNLYNELEFDSYTIYKRYFWRDEWQRPVVVYQNKVYTLIAETNKKAGSYIKPGEDASIWQEGFVTDGKS